MAKQPGLAALEKCEDQVKISIRNEVKVISKYLKDNGIIDRPLYNDVNNPESRDIPEAKASKLYLKLVGEVENDEAYYLKFVEFLRKNPKFNNTVAKLDGAYTGEAAATETSRIVADSAAPLTQSVDPGNNSIDGSSQQEQGILLHRFMWHIVTVVAVIPIACLAYYFLLGPPVPSQQPISPQDNLHFTERASSVTMDSGPEVPETTSPSLDSRPELSEMLLLKCGKKSLRIIQDVGSRCNTFGTFLGLPLQMVNNEWYAADSRIEPKCQNIVERWLEGKGKPVTWRIVLEAIQKVHPILVDDLKTCIM